MNSTELADSLLSRLVADGAREVVLCPGSRSAPLAFAAARFERDGLIRLHTRIDERTAGFLALGLSKGSHRPVVVFCTSGTAAANLHPAVLEAAHAGVRLVAVTADRPASLRGTGANQTTFQPGLYGDAAPSYDVSGSEDWQLADDGPTHLNVQFTEPLVPPAEGVSTASSAVEQVGLRPTSRPLPRPISLPIGPRTVVVAGDDAGPAARRLAEAAGWPLFAEPSSGSRTGDHAIRTYRLLLGGPLADEIERVVVYGHPTLSRPISRLLDSGREVISVPPPGRWPARPFPVSREGSAFTAEPDGTDWLDRWRDADREVSRRLDAEVRGTLGPHAVAAAVAAALPPGGQLFIGASNPVRDLDLMVPRYEVGARRKVLANRGLAGIDGTISTAIGVALTRPDARNLLLLGDVTFLHDLTGLVLGPEEVRPDLTIVVVNDDGGSIFATLEQGDPAYSRDFERLFGTPHGADLAALCAGLRIPHWRVESVAELEHALAAPNGGIEVVEARVDRANRRDLDARLRLLISPEG